MLNLEKGDKHMKLVYVSVIMPVYNAEKHLVKSIESVLQQSLQYIELVIVNDGSTDHSLDIIMSYSEKDKRIRVINKDHEGVSIARNIAVKVAKGKYIAFIDADDYVDLDMYQTMYVTLEQTRSNIAMCGYIEESNRSIKYTKLPWLDGTVIQKNVIYNQLIPSMISHSKQDIANEIIKGNVWRFLVNKEFILDHDINFNSQIALAEDLIFCIDLFSQVESIAILERCFYHYVRHNFSTLNSYRENNLEESLYVQEQLKLKLSNNNLLTENMERFITNRFLMYTCCISNCFRLGAPIYREKIKIIRNIVLECQKDQLMRRVERKHVNVSRYVSQLLIKHSFIFCLMICFDLKERFRRRRFKCKQN